MILVLSAALLLLTADSSLTSAVSSFCVLQRLCMRVRVMTLVYDRSSDNSTVARRERECNVSF